MKQTVSTEILFPVLEELMGQGETIGFAVSGMSMRPFLFGGRDQVIAERAKPEKVKKGDIVLWRMPQGKYLLHRITGLKNGMFETTGDGNCFRDGWYPLECIKARITVVIRNDKEISCDSGMWRVLSSIWMILFPLRRWILFLLGKIGMIKRRLQ